MEIFQDCELVFTDTYTPKHCRTLLVDTNAPLHSISSNIAPSSGVVTFPGSSSFSDRFIVWRALGSKLYIEERSLCKTIRGGSICLNFARTPIVPGTSITLISQSVLCIIVPTQSTVHRFHARLDTTSDLGLFSDISDHEFLHEYHTSYLISTQGHATRASVILSGAVTKIAYCMAEGQLVVVSMPNTKNEKFEEVVYRETGMLARLIHGGNAGREMAMSVCGAPSSPERDRSDVFYAAYKDGTLRAWNISSVTARSINLGEADPSDSDPEINDITIKSYLVDNAVIILVAVSTSIGLKFHFVRDHNKKLSHQFSVESDKHGNLFDFGLTHESGDSCRLYALWNNLSINNDYPLFYSTISFNGSVNSKGKWRKVNSYSPVRKVTSDLSVTELRETIFNVDFYPHNVVHRAIQICCEPPLFEERPGDFAYLINALNTYIRSPEFHAKYMERGQNLRVSARVAQEAAEKNLLVAVSSACEQLELAACGAVGLFLLDLPGVCLAGVIQQDRFSVVHEAEPSLQCLLDVLDNTALSKGWPIRQDSSEKDEDSDDDSSTELEAYDPSYVRNASMWYQITREFIKICDVQVSGKSGSPMNFDGSFTRGLIFANLRQTTRVRLAFATRLYSLITLLNQTIRDNTYELDAFLIALKRIESGYQQLVTELNLKVSNEKNNGYLVLGGWFFDKTELDNLLRECGDCTDSPIPDEVPEYNGFIKNVEMATLSALWPTSSSTILFRTLVKNKQFNILKKLCLLLGNPPEHMIYAISFFSAIAYSGIGQPVKAMTAFVEASRGVETENKALLNTLKEFMPAKKSEINLGDYYTLTIRFLHEHGHSEEVVEMSRRAIDQLPENSESAGIIYATLFNHLVNKSHWVDALNTLKKNKDLKMRRATLRELMSRLLQCQEYRTIVELRYGDMEESVEQFLMNAARSQDVTVYPHLFQVAFSFFMNKTDYVKAARTMYEYAMTMAQVPQTAELFKRRRDVVATAASILDLVDEKDRFLYFPEEYLEEVETPGAVVPDTDEVMSDRDSPVPIPIKRHIRRRRMRIISSDTLSEEFILADARATLLEVIPIPPVQPKDIVKELINAKCFDVAFDVCRICSLDVSDVMFAVARESVILDVTQPALLPDWVVRNKRYVEGRCVTDNWSVARGLLQACRSAWPVDSRPYKSFTSAILSHGGTIPCWLQAEYAELDVGGLLRCLVDYDSVSLALTILIEHIEKETAKITSPEARTLIPTSVIDDIYHIKHDKADEKLVGRLKDRLTLYCTRITSFEMASKFS